MPGGDLKYASSLEDASWPVIDIVKAVIKDGISPVICLNPSHGKRRPGFIDNPLKDIDFLRKNFKEII